LGAPHSLLRRFWFLPIQATLDEDVHTPEDDPEYGGDRLYACEVIDFQEGKIKRVRAYFGEPFEAPKWWARWVESMEP
jgi:hypothetical protein